MNKLAHQFTHNRRAAFDAGVDLFMQAGEGLFIAPDGLRVQRGDIERRGFAFQFGLGFLIFGLFGLHFLAQAAGITHTADQQFHDPPNPAVEVRDLLFQHIAPAGGGSGVFLPGLVIGRHIFDQHFRAVKLFTHGLDDQFLDRIEIEGARIGAGFAVTMIRTHDARALIAAGAIRGHAATTGPAPQKAGKEPLRALCMAGLLPCHGLAGTHRLGGIKERLIDYPVLRRILHYPLFRRVCARYTAAGVRVFDPPGAIPHNAAGIKLVAEDADAGFFPAINGISRPAIAARGGQALGIQFNRDLLW